MCGVDLQVSLILVLVLAVDTATPAVTAGVVRLTDGAATTLAQRITVNARVHAEVLTPHILECFADIGITPAGLDAVVVGVGPGPFTGLRVGMATAAAFADALGIPVHGVCTLDAIAAAAVANLPADSENPAGSEIPADSEIPAGSELLVVTDARRREIYWARYRDGVRLAGPDVVAPADLDTAGASWVAGSAPHAAMFALPAAAASSPTPESLVAVAAHALESGAAPEPLIPLYLRRPDAKTLDERAAAAAAKARP